MLKRRFELNITFYLLLCLQLIHYKIIRQHILTKGVTIRIVFANNDFNKMVVAHIESLASHVNRNR